MTRTTTGRVALLAAIGMTAGLLGAEISQLQTWAPVLQPGFVGKALVHVAAVIAAYVGGQLVPTNQKFKGGTE